MATLKGDFTKEDPWRIFRIMSEFVDGFEELSNVKKAVSIFGSAKHRKSTKRYYILAGFTFGFIACFGAPTSGSIMAVFPFQTL